MWAFLVASRVVLDQNIIYAWSKLLIQIISSVCCGNNTHSPNIIAGGCWLHWAEKISFISRKTCSLPEHHKAWITEVFKYPKQRNHSSSYGLFGCRTLFPKTSLAPQCNFEQLASAKHRELHSKRDIRYSLTETIYKCSPGAVNLEGIHNILWSHVPDKKLSVDLDTTDIHTHKALSTWKE